MRGNHIFIFLYVGLYIQPWIIRISHINFTWANSYCWSIINLEFILGFMFHSRWRYLFQLTLSGTGDPLLSSSFYLFSAIIPSPHLRISIITVHKLPLAMLNVSYCSHSSVFVWSILLLKGTILHRCLCLEEELHV